MPLLFNSVGNGVLFSGCSFTTFIRPSVHLSRQIALLRYLMNGLSNLDGTYRQYSLFPTNDMIRFWRSKVKVTAGCRGCEDIRVNAGASKYILLVNDHSNYISLCCCLVFR